MENGIIINSKEYELIQDEYDSEECIYCDLHDMCKKFNNNNSICIDVFNEPHKHFTLKTK